MSSNILKNELAEHIYQYLCHEAQYSDLPEAARESLTAASECIEQAYKLNTANTNVNNNGKQQIDPGLRPTTSTSILPDELLRIFTRHKEFLSQQKDSIIYPLRNESESSPLEKPDNRLNSHSNINDPHSGNPNNPNSSCSINQNQSTSNLQSPTASSGQAQTSQLQQQTAATTKQHNQHPISQLPMTTRKKLSHLRAQIKRQASKAARSRLEKRSSVSGVTSGSSSFGGGPLSAMLGASLDANNGLNFNKQAGDSHNTRDTGHQLNSPSVDSPGYLNSQSTSSPTNPGGSSHQADSNTASGGGPHNDSGAGSSGATKSSSHVNSSSHHNHPSIGVSVHQKNFKQKLIALIKKFRTDGSGFDSEEQYREALERELMKAAAGRGSRAIEELLEEDIDVEGESGSEPEDWDNISESSTPKPSLRPFFSSTTLDKI